MSDARSVVLKVLHGYSTKDSYIDWELSDADAILAALAEAGLVIVPATLLHKIPNEPPMSGKPQITLEGSE